MSIFILEDDFEQAVALRQLVETLCATLHVPYETIETTSKPDELLARIPHCTYIPIYFLDIEIKGDERKGLDVARAIRKLDTQGIIVFVTTHHELAPISYEYMVSALTFIHKTAPLAHRQQQLAACLQHYKERNATNIEEDYFVIDNDYTTIKVPFASVEYIMTDTPHRLQLVTTAQMIQFYGKLKDIEDMDARLIRCHKSFVVNSQHIRTLDRKNQLAVLASGKTVLVSRRCMKTLAQQLKGEFE